jgi:hypothetical protein
VTGRGIAAALVAAAVVLLLLAPFLLGLHAEQVHRQLLHGLAERGYRIIQNDYKRGWLASSAVVLIAPSVSSAAASRPATEPAPEPARLQLTSRIQHGPRAGEWRRWPPVLATTRSRLSSIGGPRPLPPLLVDAAFAGDGGIAGALRMPDVAYSGLAGRLNLVDWRSSLRTDAGMADWQVEGALHRLEAVDADTRGLVLDGLGWRVAVRQTPDRQGWRRAVTMSLADADVGLPAGEASLSLDRLELDGGGRLPPVAAAGLRLLLRAAVAGEQASLDAELGIDELSVDHAAFAPSRVRLSLARLDAPALFDLRDGLTVLSARNLPPSLRGLAIGALLTQSLPQLLSAAPRLALDELTLMTPKGPVTATAVIELRNDVPAGLPQHPVWLTPRGLAGLSGEARISAPRALILQLLLDQQQRRVREELRHRGEPDNPLPPRLEAEVAAAASAALAALIRDGWLLTDGDRLLAAAVLGDGRLALNGKPLPVAGLARP